MAMHVRVVDGVAVLSNVGRLMNDPRYTSAGAEVDALAAQGVRAFVIELRDVREAGAPLLGLLMTLTRRARGAGGEVALARPSKGLAAYLDEMRMDDYWDVFPDVDGAVASFRRDPPEGPDGD